MLYLDSSAVVKIVSREPETADMVRLVRADPSLVSSALAWTEVVRVVRMPGNTARAEDVLSGIALVPIDDGIIRSAATLVPPSFRTLNSIHLATVLSLGADVSHLMRYDDRLAGEAGEAGIDVIAPGRG